LSTPLTLGAATLALATWGCFGLGLGSATTTCVYLLIIVLLSLMDFVSSVIFSIIAVGCLDFFFQTPLFDFGVENAQDLTTLFVFLITSIVIASLVRRVRRLEEVHRGQAPLLGLTRDSVAVDNRRERARRAFEGRLYRQMMGLATGPPTEAARRALDGARLPAALHPQAIAAAGAHRHARSART
jgi:hypothetical protein